ncbi:MAG: OmpH/Skp family outer membrane protein [Planctomycetota bacterium]
MRQPSMIVRGATALGLLLLVAAVVGPSYATRSGATPRPAVVATVDLEKVFNEIDRRAEAEIRLEQQAEGFRDQADVLRSEAELLKQDLDLLVPGTPQYQQAEKRWKQAVLDYRALAEFSKAKLDAKRAAFRTQIYQRIIDAAGSFCADHGIDFVLTDDSVIELQQGTDLQIIQQMALRRVVYANPEFDITDDLIAWINERESSPLRARGANDP